MANAQFHTKSIKKLNGKEKRFINDLKKELKSRLNDDFIDLILFGSKARGDHTQDSDIDILLVVSSKKYEDVIDEVLLDLEIKHDIYNVSLLIYPKKEYEEQMTNGINLFFKNVKREGIHVWQKKKKWLYLL